MASPLPSLRDENLRRSLIGTFDTQKATIEKLGPTEDYVRLQITLIQAELIHDRDSASTRLLEVFYYVAEIAALETKTACLARLVSELKGDGTISSLADTKDVLEAAERELNVCIEKLLQSTANHDEVCERVIQALAKHRADLAFKIIESFNTRIRRDTANAALFDEILRQPARQIPFGLLNEKLNVFEDKAQRDGVLEDLLGTAWSFKNETIAELLPVLKPFIGAIEQISDLGIRSRADCHALSILAQGDSNESAGLIAKVERDLDETWKKMELGGPKIEAGFKICSTVSVTRRTLAIEYLNRADQLRRGSALDYNDQTTYTCIRLALRAYTGLLPQRFDKPSDFDKLVAQIERVLPDSIRISLWSELALRCFQYENVSIGKQIVSDRIKPGLESVHRRSPEEWVDAIITSAPALYQNHKQSTVELLSRLQQPRRDEACENITAFIFRKLPPDDPYAAPNRVPFPDLSYEDALDICELLELVENDSQIYDNITVLVDSITCKHRRKVFSTQQRADVAQKLTALSTRKFPNPRFIVHDGYKIITNAQIAKLVRQRPFPWEQLVADAKQIPNSADSGFVLTALADICTDIDLENRAKVLREAKRVADQIPSTLDRLGRYEFIATVAQDVDLALCKQCINEALEGTKVIQKSQAKHARRRLVDLAHSINSSLAGTLADALDDDEAREDARERIELQEERKRIAEGTLELRPEEADSYRIADNMWALLGQLNASRVEALPVGRSRLFVEIASRMPLSRSYSVFCWVIENAIRRRARSTEARTLMRGLFEASLVGCDLAYMLGGRSAGKLRDAIRLTSTHDKSHSFIVRTGQREDALAFLKEWIAQNATGYLKICDPYFGPEDLQVLQIILGCAPSLFVSILTSKKHQDENRGSLTVEQSFQQQWRRISDQAPPKNDIWIVGTPSGELPVHERWWLSRKRGLRIGTSYNSIGGKRESEISILNEAEAESREAEIDEFIFFKKREHGGQRLSISLFSVT